VKLLSLLATSVQGQQAVIQYISSTAEHCCTWLHLPAQVEHCPFVVHAHFVHLGTWPGVQRYTHTRCSRLAAALIRLAAALIRHPACCGLAYVAKLRFASAGLLKIRPETTAATPAAARRQVTLTQTGKRAAAAPLRVGGLQPHTG
jgi:hypothetical protein